jgi:formylglycine-generating enzyme required for sulfatase activity
MHGNVMEWVADLSGSYPSGPVVDPTGPASGTTHIWRGGSWAHIGKACRSAYRDSGWPDSGSDSVGFRLAFSPP